MVVDSPIVAVYKENYTDSTMRKIAIKKHSNYQSIYAKIYYPKSKVVIYCLLYTSAMIINRKDSLYIFNNCS